ncbi:MinD/ParA family protein [Haladaptatus sp. CMAA 1911]|uniref:MinD/ParA family ATP-binding protein n=1 Tax=unclassified Haladaptatus TaxID=2622732 RepID=UPI003754F51B
MLAIAGGKGGCGKTTTTLGLAGALGRMRRSVVAVDADVDMPDLHLLAGVTDSPNLSAVADGEPVESATHPPPSLTGVGVVPAPQSVAVSVHLPTALPRLSCAADHVLVDCPAGAGPDAATPLRIADHVLLVTTPDPACLRDTAKTAAMARALGTTIIGVVTTRADHPPSKIERLFDCPMLSSIPDGGVAALVDESVRRGYDRLASALLSKHL